MLGVVLQYSLETDFAQNVEDQLGRSRYHSILQERYLLLLNHYQQELWLVELYGR